MKKKVIHIIMLFIVIAITGVLYMSATAQSGKKLFCTRCVCPGETQYQDYYCDSSNPYFNYCDCKCYAKKNFDASTPGGCNTWADCK